MLLIGDRTPDSGLKNAALSGSGIGWAREVALDTVERTILLQGDRGLGRYPKPDLLAPVMTTVHSSLLDAVRMAFLHSSRPKGRVPQTLAAAADVRFVGVSDGHGDGSTRMVFRVPTFEAVAPDFFQQPALWPLGPRPSDTAFEALGSALRAVAARDSESSSFDTAMLRRVLLYRRALKNRSAGHCARPHRTHRQRCGCGRARIVERHPRAEASPCGGKRGCDGSQPSLAKG
jgi:hypothetical protein